MTIQKGEKVYTVKELLHGWKLERVMDGVSVAFNVPKDICETFDELCEYVSDSDLF